MVVDPIHGWDLGALPRSGTVGRGPAPHAGLFPPSLRVFRLAVREPLARRIPGWICLGSQAGRSGCPGVSSITSGLGCPVLAPIAPHTAAGLGWMSRRAAPQRTAKKSGIWENLGAGGKRSVGRSDLSSEGPQSCDPDPWPCWKPLEGRGRAEDLGFVPVPRSADSRVTGRESSFPNAGRCSCSNPAVTAVCWIHGGNVQSAGGFPPSVHGTDPRDRAGSCPWPGLTPRSRRCLRTVLLLISVLFFGVVCEHSWDFCSAPLHSPIPGSGTGEMVSGRGICGAR